MKTPEQMNDAEKPEALACWLDGVDDGRIIPTRTPHAKLATESARGGGA